MDFRFAFVIGVACLMQSLCGQTLRGADTRVAGTIRGRVMNASRDGAAVGGAEVVLRVQIEGQFVVAAEGMTDAEGRFVFDDLPADADYIYLPGANREDVHYPAARVCLTADRPHAQVDVMVRDTIAEPCPLVARRHEITIHHERHTLRVRERLLIENPGTTTYVGKPKQIGGRATTLNLSIPSNFRRTTFDKEFYGRQFTLIDDQLATDIPWTPGERELAFTYLVANADIGRVWQRLLDLPCEFLQIKVHTADPGEVSCSLPRVASPDGQTLVFNSDGKPLQAGEIVRVELERPPLSLAKHGRWIALSVLVGLVLSTGLIRTQILRGHRSSPEQ